MAPVTPKEPSIQRSVTLHLAGDWGAANFHRVFSWLTQEFCDRAGPRSRTAIWSLRDGGMDTVKQVFDGECHVGLVTPASLMPAALVGEGIFARTGPMPSLRALGTLPQRDRMMFAVDPKYGVRSFEDIRRIKPPLRIAVSDDDGTNFIGYISMRLMEAHGISKETLESWGGCYIFHCRPDQCTSSIHTGESSAIVQEAIITPWWEELIEAKDFVPIPFETNCLRELQGQQGFVPTVVEAGFWKNLTHDVTTTDFSDFLVLVRDDLAEDIAYQLTWCLVETRKALEVQYRHIPAKKSPLTYPLNPYSMAKTTIPLHPGAKRFYEEAGYLED